MSRVRALQPETLAQKVWERHVVHTRTRRARPAVHRPAPRPRGHQPAGVRRAAADRPRRCAGPTSPSPPRTTTCRPSDIDQPIADPISARQVEVLRENTAEFGIVNFPMGDPSQGIVHVIGPEQGRTLPGMTIVCGDSHTATHGAFGALAFGIGTSEVEHVLATQTLPQTPAEVDERHRRRRAARRRHRQGRHPRDHRRHRHRRRHRPRHRVPRLGDPRAVDGGPDDGVQHEHRGRRQGRPDRARRHDVRVPARAAPTRRPATHWDAAVADWRTLHDRRRRGVRQGGRHRRGHDHAAGHLGHQPRPGRRHRRTSCRRPTASTTRRRARPSTRALEYMGLDGRHADPRHHGRHRVHRQLHQQPHRGPARRGRGDEGPHRHGASG